MKDQEIDFSDTPELTPRCFARAVVRRGLKPLPRKEQLTLRLVARTCSDGTRSKDPAIKLVLMLCYELTWKNIDERALDHWIAQTCALCL